MFIWIFTIDTFKNIEISYKFKQVWTKKEVINKFLLAGYKCMSEIYSRQHGLTYSSSGTFIKKKERRKELKETRDLRYIYQNELGKACFQHDMAYGDFKDLPRRTTSDKVLHEKVFNIAKNSKYDKYRHGLATTVYKLFE